MYLERADRRGSDAFVRDSGTLTEPLNPATLRPPYVKEDDHVAAWRSVMDGSRLCVPRLDAGHRPAAELAC